MEPATLDVTVDEIRREAADIFSFRLVDPARGDLPAATPGAHIDVHIRPGLVRQYSLCNGPEERSSYTIAVKRQPGGRGGSVWMDDTVKTGDRLTIGAPVNHFPLDLTAPRPVLVAGGVGITPLLSMALHLLAAGADFRLHYFARSADEAAFRDRLSRPDCAGKVEFHFGASRPDIRAWAEGTLAERPDGGQLYLCGPLPFMAAMRSAAAPRWPPDSIRAEYFTADQQRLSAPGDPFEVVLARQGGTFAVPADETIEQVLEANGVAVNVSCEEGVCGTCVTRVLDGVPDHRDTFLSDAEKASNALMTICVSRAKTRTLVLDL